MSGDIRNDKTRDYNPPVKNRHLLIFKLVLSIILFTILLVISITIFTVFGIAIMSGKVESPVLFLPALIIGFPFIIGTWIAFRLVAKQRMALRMGSVSYGGSSQGNMPLTVEKINNNEKYRLVNKRQRIGKRNMIFGALWCMGGIIITVITYNAATKAGGQYIIAWGAIAFGAIQFFKGVIQFAYAEEHDALGLTRNMDSRENDSVAIETKPITGSCSECSALLNGLIITWTHYTRSVGSSQRCVGYLCKSCGNLYCKNCKGKALNFSYWSGLEKSVCKRCHSSMASPEVIISH